MSYNEHDKWAWQFSHAHTKVVLVRESPTFSRLANKVWLKFEF